jgi:DNA-binding response OmpR family regulator
MTAPNPQVLVVDDDPEITSVLSRGLALHGYDALSAHGVDAALEGLRGGPVDAAIIDVMIGADSGLDLVRQIRGAGFRMPILMLSALSEVDDRARGLEAGADDYVVKPFSLDELAARLSVQVRRNRSETPRPARMDKASWTLAGGGRTVTLTQREFALLTLFAAHPGEILSRPHIFETLWSGEGASSENVVDVYVGYLRRKLDPAGDFGFEIRTIRNRGFVLEGVPPRNG